MSDDTLQQARLWVQREPGNAIAWIMLAEHALDAGDAQTGVVAAQRALRLQAGHPEALARLGRGQWMRGHFDDAVTSLRMAAANAPSHPGIAVWLAHVLEDVGEAEAASESYAHAYALAPDEPLVAAYLLAWRRRLCDWRELAALSQQIHDAVNRGNASIEPFAFLSEDASAAEQLRCARQRAAVIAAQVRPLPPATRACGDLIRAGFLSNGFGAHPTGLLTVAMFEALRTQPSIEAHLFALNPDDGSRERQRLQTAVHALHDVSSQSHARIATAIRDAGIDVLFDLRGWGGGGVPEVLAMRPAPVQVNWLAYPGTSGAAWIDYLVADDFVVPASAEPHYSETVLRLPRCFQPSDTCRVLPVPAPRSAYGLPECGVVFCCFNNSYKLNPGSFSRAMRVLHGVEGSVLWLLSGPGRADQRLRDAARVAGIDPARLVFMAKQPQAEYLARLQYADLFLDTNPYNAHTTASDALWAGCPVLTRPGETFAARVAGSLNHHLGLAEMNVEDDVQFVVQAIALGRDPARLRELRMRLQVAKSESGLFDMAAFASDFAALVQRMANTRRTGAVPT